MRARLALCALACATAVDAHAGEFQPRFGMNDWTSMLTIAGGTATTVLGAALWASGQHELDHRTARNPYFNIRSVGIGLTAGGAVALTDGIIHALVPPTHRWITDWVSDTFVFGGGLELVAGAVMWGVADARANHETAVRNVKPSDDLLLAGVAITSIGIGCLAVGVGRVVEIIGREKQHDYRLSPLATLDGGARVVGLSLRGSL